MADAAGRSLPLRQVVIWRESFAGIGSTGVVCMWMRSWLCVLKAVDVEVGLCWSTQPSAQLAHVGMLGPSLTDASPELFKPRRHQGVVGILERAKET